EKKKPLGRAFFESLNPRGTSVRVADRPAKTPRCPSKRGPRFDGTMRRSVADVEARRSPAREAWMIRLPLWKDRQKRGGAQSLIGYPSRESDRGSHRRES